MPTWSGILRELHDSLPEGRPPDFDGTRRKYLAKLAAATNRDTVLYASKFTQSDDQTPPGSTSINDEDIQGLMEVIHGLSGPRLDLILHSPGGSLEAAEAFVQYVRSKFHDVRVVVPQLAMSAATMIACSANVILMGKHSFLGPIDPQLVLQTSLGVRMVPCHAILRQFDRAVRDCRNPGMLAAWMPMLPQYGPDLLEVCERLDKRSRRLVAEWLRDYMLAGDADAAEKAESIAAWLAASDEHGSHGRHISRDELEQQDLEIRRLEEDQETQDLFLSVFHATTHTFNGTRAVKILENHRGKAFIKQAGPLLLGVQPPQQAPG